MTHLALGHQVVPRLAPPWAESEDARCCNSKRTGERVEDACSRAWPGSGQIDSSTVPRAGQRTWSEIEVASPGLHGAPRTDTRSRSLDDESPALPAGPRRTRKLESWAIRLASRSSWTGPLEPVDFRWIRAIVRGTANLPSPTSAPPEHSPPGQVLGASSACVVEKVSQMTRTTSAPRACSSKRHYRCVMVHPPAW